MATRISRRNLLGTVRTAALGAALPGLVPGCTTERRVATRDEAGADAAAEPPDREELPGLPSEKGLWQLVNQMNDLGPRYTGGRAHSRFVELLAAGFESL